jgi:electron transfer flavoprotein alpha subunit
MSGEVFVVLQDRDGSVHPVAAEAVTAAKELASALGTTAEAIALGGSDSKLASQAAEMGVARVLSVEGPGLEGYTPAAYTQAIAHALSDREPSYVVFGHTYQSVDCMARVAHELQAAIVPEILSFEADDAGSDGGLVFLRLILEGKMQAKVRVRAEGPVVVSVQSAAFDAAASDGAPCEVSSLENGSWTADRELLGIEDVAGEAVDLTAAERIVSVGRGIGGPDKLGIIEELAAELGAELGASRPVIDSGWLARDRQIGSSGQTVAPKLYLAVGISGAIQHLVGMKGAACTVAINKDAGAPIFTVADYGIVGDLFEVVPALTAALREAGS